MIPRNVSTFSFSAHKCKSKNRKIIFHNTHDRNASHDLFFLPLITRHTKTTIRECDTLLCYLPQWNIFFGRKKNWGEGIFKWYVMKQSWSHPNATDISLIRSEWVRVRRNSNAVSRSPSWTSITLITAENEICYLNESIQLLSEQIDHDSDKLVHMRLWVKYRDAKWENQFKMRSHIDKCNNNSNDTS